MRQIVGVFVSSARKTWGVLRRIHHPAAYVALVYAAVLFGFPVIYVKYHQEFHHQVAANDQSVVTESEEISDDLLEYYRVLFENHHGANEITSQDGWSLDVTSVTAQSVEVVGESVVLHLQFPFWDKSRKPIVFSDWRVSIAWPINYSQLVEGATNTDGYFVGYPTLSRGSVATAPMTMSQIFPPTTHPMATQLRLIPSSDLLKRMIDLVRSAQGDIGTMQGSYWRMWYLSAATITTLGYGDIVPTTDFARALVAIEAILGVLLPGAFVTFVLRRNPLSAGVHE